MHSAKTIQFSVFFSFLMLFLLSSCWKQNKSTEKYKPVLEKKTAKVDVVRFDQELMSLDTTNISQAVELLKEKHPEFTNLYLKQILSGGRPVDVVENLKGFLSIKEAQLLQDSIQQLYNDLNWAKSEIEAISNYYNYYFNKAPFEKVYTFFSFYNYGIFTLDNYAGIGLDFFLGANHVGYISSETLRPQYIRRTLTREHICPKLAYAIANQLIDEQASKKSNSMIDEMLFNGKKFYIAAALQPEVADSLIYGFSNFQIQFCQRGERALWEHLGKEQLLYSSEYKKFRKYVEEGPFNPDINLPGNSASWLGAQIITQYANRLRKELKMSNASASIQEIDQKIMQSVIQENDPSKFLQKYKPVKY